MPRLVDYPPSAGSLIKEKIGTGGKWNWRTNLGDAADLLLPSTPQESLTAGVLNVGMAGMLPQGPGRRAIPTSYEQPLKPVDAPSFQYPQDIAKERVGLEELSKVMKDPKYNRKKSLRVARDEMRLYKQKMKEIEQNTKNFNQKYNEYVADSDANSNEWYHDPDIEKWFALREKLNELEAEWANYEPLNVGDVNDAGPRYRSEQKSKIKEQADFETLMEKMTESEKSGSEYYALSFEQLGEDLNTGRITEEQAIKKYGKAITNKAVATFQTPEERQLYPDALKFFKDKAAREQVMTANPGPGNHPKTINTTDLSFADREHELSDYIADHWFSGAAENEWRLNTPIRQDVVKEGRRAKWAGEIHESQKGPNGEHLTRFHGTKKDFDSFWSIEDRPILSHVGAIDQIMGPHFGADPAVGESFALTAGSPAGAGKPGGRVIPVKLRIRNPKIVWQPKFSNSYADIPGSGPGARMWDQSAVALDLWETVGSASRTWFREWLNLNSREKRYSIPKEIANEIFSLFQAGKEVPNELIKEAGYTPRSAAWYSHLMEGNAKDPYMASIRGNPWSKTGFIGNAQEFIRLHDFHGFETSMEPVKKKNLIKTYQRILKSQGYDSVQYLNTSETETKWARDFRTWIVFDKDQIKGVFGRFTSGDPDFMKGVAITGAGIEAEERANRRTR